MFHDERLGTAVSWARKGELAGLSLRQLPFVVDASAALHADASTVTNPDMRVPPRPGRREG